MITGVPLKWMTWVIIFMTKKILTHMGSVGLPVQREIAKQKVVQLKTNHVSSLLNTMGLNIPNVLGMTVMHIGALLH